ncbi:MAG: hypothetical protein M1823_006619, partial [Watsoniomyces obsoletus]
MTDTPVPTLTAMALASLLVAGCGPSPEVAPEPPSARTAAARDADRQDAGDAAAARLGIDIPRPLEPGAVRPTTPHAAAQDEAGMARAILADPAAYRPETYVYVTKYLWERGDRRQAAFWHFLFQIRTDPWLPHDRNLGPLRSGVNASLGALINEWLGSEYDAWLETTRRAISYERRMPLSPERPAGLSQAQWSAAVAEARAAWETDFQRIT